jgi:branched-chain amino acid transport system substrate-binding protein
MLATLVAAIMAMAACGDDDDGGGGSAQAGGGNGGAPLAGETVTIGAIFPITGPFSAAGKGNRDGAQAAVDYLNAQGSKSGAKFKLDVRDDQGNLTQTVAIAREFGDSAPALIAGSTGGGASAMAPILARTQVPLVSAAITGLEDNPEKYPWAYGVGESNLQRQLPTVKYAIENAGGAPIAEIYTTDAYGGAFHEAFEGALEGAELIAKGVAPTTPDMTAQLRELQRSGAKVLVINAFGEPSIKIAQNLAQLGWRPKVATLLGALSPSYVEVLQKQAPDVLEAMLAGPLPKPLLTDKEGGQPSTEMARAWAEEMKKVTGRAELTGDDLVGTYGFDSVLAVDEALAKAGSTDGPAVREALDKVTFDGSRGRIAFAPDNHVGQQDEDLALAQARYPCPEGACVAAK